LKNDGITARGVRIGDEYSTVTKKYGEPHKTLIIDDQNTEITYSTPAFPNIDSCSLLHFYLINQKE